MTATAVFSLELASGALTRWVGTSPIALCRHEGRVLASDGTNLLHLSGESDDGAPIPIWLSLPATDCGAPAPKRLTGLRLTGVLGDTLTVGAQSDIGTRLVGEAPPVGRDGLPGTSLARLGRGHGRIWRFALEAQDGNHVDIAAIEPECVILDRRVG